MRSRACWLAAVLITSVAQAAPATRMVAARPYRAGTLRLVVDASGVGELRYGGRGAEQTLPCEPLVGAWGLWVGDVDGDGVAEAIVALRKVARFDPVLENRLHVYHLVDGQCVPAWRGTRLAGRFERLTAQGDRLLVLERIGAGRRRVARYRWRGFGYGLERIIWEGRGLPGGSLLAQLDGPRE